MKIQRERERGVRHVIGGLAWLPYTERFFLFNWGKEDRRKLSVNYFVDILYRVKAPVPSPCLYWDERDRTLQVTNLITGRAAGPPVGLQKLSGEDCLGWCGDLGQDSQRMRTLLTFLVLIIINPAHESPGITHNNNDSRRYFLKF